MPLNHLTTRDTEGYSQSRGVGLIYSPIRFGRLWRDPAVMGWLQSRDGDPFFGLSEACFDLHWLAHVSGAVLCVVQERLLEFLMHHSRDFRSVVVHGRCNINMWIR